MDRLAELRERRALTLRELAEMSGVAADTINQIELGHRKARPSTLRKLAKALGVEIRELFEEPALPLGEAPREAGPTTERSYLPWSASETHEKVSVGERLLSYIRSQKLETERMRKRWEEAAEHNKFSYDTWNEAAEIAIEKEQSFADAIPVEIYATGDKWLPPEEWNAVAELYGNISLLKTTLERALRAYQSKFGEKGAPADVKDFAAIREQRGQRTADKRRANEQDHQTG